MFILSCLVEWVSFFHLCLLLLAFIVSRMGLRVCVCCSSGLSCGSRLISGKS